jgi:hypothetical protein
MLNPQMYLGGGPETQRYIVFNVWRIKTVNIFYEPNNSVHH